MSERDEHAPPVGIDPSAGAELESAGAPKMASRRTFIRATILAAAVVAAAGLGYLALGSGQPSTTSSSTSRTGVGGASYPAGKRFVILPPLADYPSGQPYWTMTSYTPQQVITMLQDLQPDTLHRYVQAVSSTGLDMSATVPGSDPAMSVTEFIQASMDASASVVIPKLTLRTYNSDPNMFFSQAQAFVNANVSPPLSMLSLDEWDAFTAAQGSNSVSLIEQIIDRLKSQGWKGVEVGACGAPEIPSGYTDFSLFCVDTSNWEAELSTLSSLKAVPSNRSFQLSIDYPGPLQAFQRLSPDTQAQLLTGFASAQKQYGYSFVYPVALQFQGPAMLNYDSNKISTSSGSTLYQVMKDLMQKYN